jgi:hypothetical protein
MRQSEIAARAVRELWVGLAVGALCVALYEHSMGRTDELGIALGWIMAFLSFPASLLGGVIGGGLGWVIFKLGGGSWMEDVWGLVLLWLVMFAVGYLQWFVIIPSLASRMRERRTGRAASSTTGER